jgi:hypothetical protein
MPPYLRNERACDMTRCWDFSSAARLRTARTKVRSRFCDKPCGPSRRRSRNASVVLRNFVRHPKKTFATQSAQSRHRADERRCPVFGAKRKSASCHRGSMRLTDIHLSSKVHALTTRSSGGGAAGSAGTPAIFTRSSPSVLTPIK